MTVEIKCILQIELNTYPIYKRILIIFRPHLTENKRKNASP